MLKKVFNISIISSVLLFLFGLVLAVNAEGFNYGCDWSSFIAYWCVSSN